MISTKYGKFAGDSWEDICQVCFKLKYEEEVYIEVQATPGDFGIEGFTRQGKAFQCYCPDEEYTEDVLYEKQRDKITKDLKKLKTYETQISKRLGGTKISKWYFVTPRYSKNEISVHVTNKRDEVRSWKLSIIDNENFEVVPVDVDFLQPHLKVALGTIDKKIDFKAEPVSDEDGLKWKGKEISLITNAQNKHAKRFSDKDEHLEEKVDRLTDKSVRHFLNGNNLLRLWQNDYPEDYERFVVIKNQLEEWVEEICMLPNDGNHNNTLNLINKELQTRLKTNFEFLEDTLIHSLCHQVMADWILRCPINFE